MTVAVLGAWGGPVILLVLGVIGWTMDRARSKRWPRP